MFRTALQTAVLLNALGGFGLSSQASSVSLEHVSAALFTQNQNEDVSAVALLIDVPVSSNFQPPIRVEVVGVGWGVVSVPTIFSSKERHHAVFFSKTAIGAFFQSCEQEGKAVKLEGTVVSDAPPSFGPFVATFADSKILRSILRADNAGSHFKSADEKAELMADFYVRHQSTFTGEEVMPRFFVHFAEVVKMQSNWAADWGGGLVVDVGTGQGTTLEALMRIFHPEHGFRAVAFEPDSTKIQSLRAKLEKLSLDTAVHVISGVAISTPGSAAEAMLRPNPSSADGSKSLYSQDGPGEMVLVSTLDAELSVAVEGFVSVPLGEDIAFMNIDAEGFDNMVLSGGANVLSRTRMFSFRCWTNLNFVGPNDQWAGSLSLILQFLALHGFEVFLMGTERYLSISGRCWNEVYRNLSDRANCLAVRVDDPLREVLLEPFMDNLPTCVSISESLHTGDKQTLGEPTAMSKQLWRPPTVRPPKSSFHSQNGEDELFYDVYLNLTEPLHEPPVFVEVGALDGWTYSNSHVFEVEMGWRAVLIEAQPNCWPELERNRPNASIVREAVCADGPKQIHILSAWTIRADNPGCHAVAGQPSQMTTSYMQQWGMQEWMQTYSQWEPPFGHVVGCRSLGVMLREANVTRVEAMSVDIEGGELDALSSMDWTIPVHWLIIEMSGHDHQKEAALRSVLELRKFTLRDTQRGSEWFQSTVWPQPAVTPFGPPKD